ncbi:hypothetical protein DPMN_071721 [Dreissena polymorpha]|uniref:Uncharacterized protein n=1 Tax=Dreissena polymorpha TaxID=45954 RepID=A0A9D3Z529_DREPO|nr:hypothetical protein DPMN_071721 [Dreissena polymorpha]
MEVQDGGQTVNGYKHAAGGRLKMSDISEDAGGIHVSHCRYRVYQDEVAFSANEN